MPKYLVTGGAGMIGSHIVDLLVDMGDVIVLDNLEKGDKDHVNPKADFREVNIGYENISDHFKGVDYVFHQSAYRITRCAEKPTEAVQSMAQGAVDIWNASEKHGIKKIIFASSASVYGQAEQFPTKDTHHFNGNNTIYGGLKAFTESLARSRDIPFVGLRYHTVYGPRMDGNGKYSEVFIIWYKTIKAEEKPLVFGNATMDPVFCKDVASANIACLNDVASGVFNVCSGEFVSISKVCDLIGQEMVNRGHNYDGYEFKETGERSFFRWGHPGNFRRIWKPHTSLESGIKQFVDYMDSR